MRYMLAMLLALGIGIATVIPVALSQNTPDRACYQDGVVSSCPLPAPVDLGVGSSVEIRPSPAPGYDAGYDTVVPSRPFWVVQFHP